MTRKLARSVTHPQSYHLRTCELVFWNWSFPTRSHSFREEQLEFQETFGSTNRTLITQKRLSTAIPLGSAHTDASVLDFWSSTWTCLVVVRLWHPAPSVATGSRPTVVRMEAAPSSDTLKVGLLIAYSTFLSTMIKRSAQSATANTKRVTLCQIVAIAIATW